VRHFDVRQRVLTDIYIYVMLWERVSPSTQRTQWGDSHNISVNKRWRTSKWRTATYLVDNGLKASYELRDVLMHGFPSSSDRINSDFLRNKHIPKHELTERYQEPAHCAYLKKEHLLIFKECILLCLFVLLCSFLSQHKNVKNSLTFTVYNEFIGLDGIATCFGLWSHHQTVYTNIYS
jgi:hypothetical protein